MQSIANIPLGHRLGKLPHSVKGNYANDISESLGSIPQMEITRQMQLDMIADGIIRLGTNQHALERAAGIPVGTIKDLKRGKRALVSDKWQRILNVLNSAPKKETALPEPVVALVDTFKLVMALLIKKNIASTSEILSVLTHQKADYLQAEQMSSLEVTEELIAYLSRIQNEKNLGRP